MRPVTADAARRGRGWAPALAFWACWAAGAQAQGQPSPPTPAASDPVARDEPGTEREATPDKTRTQKRAIGRTDMGLFGLKGRVFAGLELRRDLDQVVVGPNGIPNRGDHDSLDVTLDSARLSVLYEAPFRWLAAEVEIEASDPDQAELRDAYLEARTGITRIKVGNFKLPTSAIELDSRWDLPSPRRGLIHELLTEYLDVAGRHPGVQLMLRHDDGIEPTLMLGAFQGSVLVEHLGPDRDTELIDRANLRAQSWTARAEVELGDFDVGLFYEHRVVSPGVLRTRHAPVTGADLVYDEELGDDYGLRAWLDVHWGESWYAHASKPPEQGDPWFLALRAVVAGRYGGTSDGTFYVEPFGTIGVLDPDLQVATDWAREYSLGVNVGLWDRARLTLEGFTNKTFRSFPESYFQGPRGRSLGLTLMAGVAF